MRGDPYFHRPSFRNLIKNLIAVVSNPLGSLITYSEETWDASDGRFLGTFPYIEISGVGLGTNEYQVTETLVSEAPSRARQIVRADDILISLTRPHRGAVANVLPEHDGAIASTGFAIVRDVKSARLHKDYLQLYLTSRFGSEQMLMRSSGGSYPAITREDLSKVLIPEIGIERQQTLSKAMAEARTERKRKLAEADALLAGLDNFVLDALGIAPNPPQKPTFAVRAADAQHSRIDADFHSLRFRTIRDSIDRGSYPTKSIGEVCEQVKAGFPAGRQAQAFDFESGTPHLRPLNLDTFGQLTLEGTKFVPSESVSSESLCIPGEVLFNNTNSTELVGKSAVFNLQQPCACSNHMTRLRPNQGVNPEFLAAVLNSLRRLGYLGLLSTNFNNQAGINAATLSQVRIPIPATDEQERIAAEVVRRRDKSRSLRAEAESGWQEAKRWFEEQLLGN